MLFSGLLVSKNTYMVSFQTHSIQMLGDIIFYVIYSVKPPCAIPKYLSSDAKASELTTWKSFEVIIDILVKKLCRLQREL